MLIVMKQRVTGAMLRRIFVFLQVFATIETQMNELLQVILVRGISSLLVLWFYGIIDIMKIQNIARHFLSWPHIPTTVKI